MRSINIASKQYNAEEMISEFLLLQEQKGVTENTLRLHRYSLVALHKDCVGVPMETQLRRCLPQRMGNAYYNKRLSTYRQFFSMLLECGHIQYDPTKEWHYRKTTFNLKNYQECNVRKFLSAIDVSTFAGLRDYIMCLFIIDTGIRPSEVCQILKEDVDMVHGQIYLRGEITKTKTPRTVPISNLVLQKIKALHSYEIWDNKYLFCSSDGKQFTTMSFRHNLHKVALKSGVCLTPYDFRHIFATTYIRNGGDVFTLQRIMGHTKPSMTMVYVNLNPQDLTSVHKRVNVVGNFVSARARKINQRHEI